MALVELLNRLEEQKLIGGKLAALNKQLILFGAEVSHVSASFGVTAYDFKKDCNLKDYSALVKKQMKHCMWLSKTEETVLKH